MATVHLRVRLGLILEELPAACLYCGTAVDAFTPLQISLESEQVKFPIPLCQAHQREEDFREFKGNFKGETDWMLVVGVDLGDVVGQLAENYDKSFQHGEKEYKVCGVSRLFVRELERIRGREAQEFENNLLGVEEPAPPTVRAEAASLFAALEQETVTSVERRRPVSARLGGPRRTLYVALVFLVVAACICGKLYLFLK